MKKFIYILIAVILTSCGARKSSSSTQDIKIEQKVETTDSISLVSEKTESLIDTSSVYEESFEPIDSMQPMVIDKKKGIFKNTRFKTSKSKKGITTAKKEESVLNQKKTTSDEISTDIETKDKEVERESNFPWWLILVIIGIILGYLEYRRE